MNIYSKDLFDDKPEHIFWAINGHDYASPVPFLQKGEKLQYNLEFQYKFKIQRKVQSFRLECLNAAKRINSLYNFKKIAVCISGSDSEIAARCFHNLGVNMELWHQRYWTDEEDFVLKKAKKLSKELSCPLNIIEVNKEQAIEQIKKTCLDVGILAGGYYANTYLLENIPENHYIIIGEGDFEKRGPTYQAIFEHFNIDDKRNVLPIHPTEILFRLWAQQKKRRGCYYFFSSTPELIMATATHPKIQKNISDNTSLRAWSVMEMKLLEWPELIFKEPTKPFLNANDIRLTFIETCRSLFREKKWLELFNEFKFSAIVDLDRLIRDNSRYL